MRLFLLLLFLAPLSFSIASENHEGKSSSNISNLNFKFGGYAKLDMILDFNGHRNTTQFLLREIPVRGDEDYGNNGYFNMHMRETRVNLEIEKDEKRNFFIEYDFYDEENINLRLRHAYFEYGNFIVGQTWTNVSDLAALPFMIDFAFGDSLFGGRRPQLRWQPQISKNTQLGFALEEPSFTSIENPSGLSGQELPKFPIFSSRVTTNFNKGHTMLGGEITQLNWDGSNGDPSDSALSWVLINSGSYSLLPATAIKWQVSYGISSSKGIIGLAPNGSNAVIKSNGKLDTDRASTLVIGLVQKITEKLSSNFVYSGLDVITADERLGEDIKSGQIIHANIIYQLEEDIMTGIEYIWGKSTNVDDASGENNRLQAMVRYDF